MRQQNGALKGKLQESIETIESDANMIKWLNKQLNEKASNPVNVLSHGGTFGDRPQPPTGISLGKYNIPSLTGGAGAGLPPTPSVAGARSPRSMSFAAGGASSIHNSAARVNNFMSPARS